MSPATLLLTEDDDEEFMLTFAAAERVGIGRSLRRFRDGAELLAFLCRAGTGSRFVVLLDAHLPGMDGFEVLRRLRAMPALRGIPVLLFTGSAGEDAVARAYELGANSFIRKPIGFNRLVEALAVVRDYWLRVAETPPLAEEVPHGR